MLFFGSSCLLLFYNFLIFCQKEIRSFFLAEYEEIICPRLRFNVLSIDYVRVRNCFYDYDYDYDYSNNGNICI